MQEIVLETLTCSDLLYLPCGCLPRTWHAFACRCSLAAVAVSCNAHQRIHLFLCCLAQPMRQVLVLLPERLDLVADALLVALGLRQAHQSLYFVLHGLSNRRLGWQHSPKGLLLTYSNEKVMQRWICSVELAGQCRECASVQAACQANMPSVGLSSILRPEGTRHSYAVMSCGHAVTHACLGTSYTIFTCQAMHKCQRFAMLRVCLTKES